MPVCSGELTERTTLDHKTSCNLCAADDIQELVNFGPHPIAHNYLKDPGVDESKYPLVFQQCNECGHLFLSNPIPPETLYENYVTLSDWKFQPHIPRLIEMICQYTNVDNRSNILEVGSNDGRFLEVMKGEGFSNLVGIEPTKDAQASASEKGTETIPGFFDRETVSKYMEKNGSCDLLIARQVLEHIGDLVEFGEMLRTVVADGAYVAIEVPDFVCNLDNLDYSLWEEHVNYFTLETLTRYLSGIGVRVLYSEQTLFSGMSFTVIGQFVGSVQDVDLSYVSDVKAKGAHYAEQWSVFCQRFKEYLGQCLEEGKKVAIYGAGARLCSLVNFAGLGPYVECIVDDNAEKQNLFMPGSKLPILPSSHLETDHIGVCLLAVNTECEDMVIEKHEAYTERGGIFYSVLPPSNRLPPFWADMLI